MASKNINKNSALNFLTIKLRKWLKPRMCFRGCVLEMFLFLKPCENYFAFMDEQNVLHSWVTC